MINRIILALCLFLTTTKAVIYMKGAPRCYYGERGSLTATCENATSNYFRATGYRFDNLDETVRCLNCNLDVVGSNTFDISGNHILNLDLQRSNISALAASSFVGLVYMETLNLAHNNIKTVIPGTFKGIKKLDYLNIGYNRITMLVSDAFAELANLTVLYLNDNEMTSVDSGAFNKLFFITELYLQNNRIHQFHNACIGLSSLQILNLENNQISLLRPEDINSTSLLDLNLSGNKMRSLENGSVSTAQLRKLNVSRNEIETIKPGAFKGAKLLEEIDLDSNKITELNQYTFLRLYYLRNIHLGRNNLTALQTFAFSHVPELRYLNVANNQIKEIQRRGVLPLHSLHSLDLSNNSLTYLDYKLLVEYAPRLVFINLEGNNLPCYLVEEMMKYYEEDNVEFSIDDKYGNLNKSCNVTAKKPDIDEPADWNELSKSEKLVTNGYAGQPTPSIYVIYTLIFILLSLVIVLFVLQYKTYMQLKYGHQGDIAEVGLMSSRGLESRDTEY